MSWENWQQSAKQTFDTLVYENPDKNNVQKMASILSIMLFDKLTQPQLVFVPDIESPKQEDTEDSDTDLVKNSLIDNKMQDKLNFFIKYMNEKGLEQSTGSELHGEYAQLALENMLKLDFEIAAMLYKSADTQERELIKKSYKEMEVIYNG